MSYACFRCQRCSKPLKVSQEICAMQEGPLEAQHPASPSPKMPAAGKLEDRTSRTHHPERDRTSQESTCCAFTLLGEPSTQRTLHSIQNTILETFEIVSGQKDVDHPLCVDCMDGLLEELDAQLTLVEADTEKYKSFLERDSLVSDEERESLNAKLRAELQSLEQEEARLAQELKDMDRQHARIEAELRAAEAESRELERQEEQDLNDCAALMTEQLALTDQLSSVENQLAYAQRQLQSLSKTDIFNITFTILDDGPLGIINNFRLGRLPGIQVGWSEINAAWGQTALLLFNLSKIAGLQFQRYQLVPCGDHSYIKSFDGDGVLLLFSDGSHNVFYDNKYDRAMKAFLDCLQQFVKVVEEEEGLFLPYRIHVNGGMLEDVTGSGECYSIRTHLNTEDEWAKALKFMLTNLKLILAWASSRYYCKK
ncbi:beclin-2 [Arvicola amphibius]|uniref:beclin-2 n=1 Tax=Arvicola amphibius TaxID=1047088 RepID=UPI0018E2B063|nr:beclin-2 [Arvicola amphibius]